MSFRKGNEMSDSKTASGGGTSLLLVAFIVLKLTGVIAWSWWWVLSPMWIPLALVALLLLFIFIGKLVVEIVD